MRYLFVIITFFISADYLIAQLEYPAGKVVTDYLYSEALENPGGEDPTRRITIYLPPGYDGNDNRYPVLHYLPGFTWSDSLMIAVTQFDKLLDKAIGTGKIRPLIVVMSDQYTLYRGSFYTNSELTGNWADFTAKDVVQYVDENFRTIPHKESRGIAGHSMGGHGALKMGMLFPDVFSVVYALSPAALDVVKDIGMKSWGYRRVQELKTREEVVTGYDNFLANALIATARAFSPNLDNPPFYIDMPYSYIGDSLIVNNEVIRKWNENLPIEMLDNYLEPLQSLTAIQLDWGRNEEFSHIPFTCRAFSNELENLGVNHYAEEYIGTHGNKLWTDDGRALNDMLPFFDRYLEFK